MAAEGKDTALREEPVAVPLLSKNAMKKKKKATRLARMKAAKAEANAKEISYKGAEILAPPTTQRSIRVIEPGVVHLVGFLSLDEQRQIAKSLMEVGNREQYGFYKMNRGGERVMNAAKTRGRMYQGLSWYDEQLVSTALKSSRGLSSMCERALKLAQNADPNNIPNMVPTHLLTLLYIAKTGIRWHQDNAENDGTLDKPVISFSLGNACTFKFKHSREVANNGKEVKEIRLSSGDCLIFGGPARMIYHTVTKIFRGTSAPLADILGDARMNLTFREAPEILGREDEFRYFKGPASKKMKEAAN